MRGPQSAPPESVSTPRSKRRFTLAEANRALPLVSRIVADIVRVHGEAVDLQSEIAVNSGGSRKMHQALQARLDDQLARLEDFVDELTEIGCELKDYSVGLVDFVGRHQGRDVYLCWKLGEPEIGHWHELDAGAAGRQPVRTLREDAK
ncbi:MAG TPA: DUF2203 domain-containing protein [Humisphaera sp.]